MCCRRAIGAHRAECGLANPHVMISTVASNSRMEKTLSRSFVRTYLPWIAAAAMLLVFLITLERTVSLRNLAAIGRATGLDWHPVLIAPLQYLVTLPIRALPQGIQL